MEWIVCVGCKKIPTWHRGTYFCVNCTSSHCFLHRVSCCYETITDEPKHYETYRNMRLGSNGVDWVRSLRKIPMWLHGTNFCINCTSSRRFAPSFMQLWNDPKCTQTLCNAPKHEFRVQWGGLGAFVAKNPDVTSLHELLIAPVHPVLHRVSCSYKTITNAHKHYYNAPKHEFRVQCSGWGAFVAKNPDVTVWHELVH